MEMKSKVMDIFNSLETKNLIEKIFNPFIVRWKGFLLLPSYLQLTDFMNDSSFSKGNYDKDICSEKDL